MTVKKNHVLGLLSDVLKTKNALLQALLVLFQQCNGKRIIITEGGKDIVTYSRDSLCRPHGAVVSERWLPAQRSIITYP